MEKDVSSEESLEGEESKSLLEEEGVQVMKSGLTHKLLAREEERRKV